MPVISSLVGSPMNGADVVDGLVVDSKDPFGARLVRCLKMGVELLSTVSMSTRAFEPVNGKDCK